MSWLLETLIGGGDYIVRVLTARMSGARFGAAIGFFVLVCLIDRFTGKRVLSWTRRTVRSVGATLLIYVIDLVVFPILMSWAGELKKAYEWLNVPHVPSSVWEGMPTWLVALLAVVFYDFANYWNHRAMHLRWVWPIHAIHHSDPEVTALTTFRIHPLEGIFMWASYVVLLSWLGLPTNAIGAGGLVLMLHNQYVHVNVDWSHGPLKWFIASPRFHRWHHANNPTSYGKNLANICPLFDVLFGTYYDPGTCREPMGAKDVPENDVVKLVLFPFSEWVRMAGRLVRRRATE